MLILRSTGLVVEVIAKGEVLLQVVTQVSRNKENHYLKASSGGTVFYH